MALWTEIVETSGTDKEPYWGEYDLASDERVAYENEHYSITGINQENEVKTIFLSYEDWNSLEVNETVKLKVSLGYGQIVE